MYIAIPIKIILLSFIKRNGQQLRIPKCFNMAVVNGTSVVYSDNLSSSNPGET
jgi:hypothetical protein